MAVPSQQRHHAQKPKTAGQHDASNAIEWLNAAKGTESYRRVLGIRKKLIELETMLDALVKRKGVARHTAQEIADHSKLQDDCFQRNFELNRTLAQYPFVPVVFFNPLSGARIIFAKPKREFGRVLKLSSVIRVGTKTLTGGAPPFRIDETAVIFALTRLAANHDLQQVRLCEKCGRRWFFSLRTIDRFCSGECRKSFHSKSEEGKLKHRAAQKRYRNKQKT